MVSGVKYLSFHLKIWSFKLLNTDKRLKKFWSGGEESSMMGGRGCFEWQNVFNTIIKFIS